MIESPLRLPLDSKVTPPRRPRIDVSHLPMSIMDHRSAIWIANLMLLIIESVMFCLAIASYFYLRQNFNLWPPPQVNTRPADLNPLPGLGFSTANLVLILLSLIPIYLADRFALRMKEKATKIALVVCLITIASTCVLRWFEFSDIKFRWSDNAYASLFWTLLSLHFTHLLVAFGESVLVTAWILKHGLDYKHARDVRVTAVYWYWIAGIWVPLYLILFIGPRL